VNNHEVDERIRAALHAAAAQTSEGDLRAERAPTASTAGVPARRARWLAPVLAAAAVLAIATGTAAVLSSHQAAKVRPGQTVPPTRPAFTTPAPTTATATATTRPVPVPPPIRHRSTSAPVPRTASPQPPGGSSTGRGRNCDFAEFGCPVPAGSVFYEPLWPFANYAAEQAWQAASKNGTQPWHLDAGQTALLFAKYYLGFTDITTVTSGTGDARDAHIGVGYPLPNRKLHTAAVLHLLRYSRTAGDTAAGWEVVGSDDDPSSFTLEQPRYGSRISSPTTVGGHLTGVDENVTVLVLSQSPNGASGPGADVPAGGVDSPWHLRVPFTRRGVLTIVASTGGHLTRHERFAIQGAHT
jgi:hypothetical protein